MSERELQLIVTEANGFLVQFQKVMEESYGVKYFNPSMHYRIQLLELKSLCETLKISLRYALKILVPFWNGQKFVRKNKVPIKVLVNPLSVKLLCEAVERDYPNNEHLQIWRNAQQQRQLAIQTEQTYSVKAYVEQVRENQTRMNRVRAGNRVTKRNYRDNPWR